MNAQRRKEIDKVIETLSGMAMEVEAILAGEEEGFNNLPEYLEGSERYENSERLVSNLREAETYIQEAVEQLTEATE